LFLLIFRTEQGGSLWAAKWMRSASLIGVLLALVKCDCQFAVGNLAIILLTY
jgi:hypothetical protein